MGSFLSLWVWLIPVLFPGLPWSLPNADQCQSMPIKIMALIRNWSELINIGMNSRILSDIDRHWALIWGVLYFQLFWPDWPIKNLMPNFTLPQQSFYRSITNSVSENVKFQNWNFQIPIAWNYRSKGTAGVLDLYLQHTSNVNGLWEWV